MRGLKTGSNVNAFCAGVDASSSHSFSMGSANAAETGGCFSSAWYTTIWNLRERNLLNTVRIVVLMTGQYGKTRIRKGRIAKRGLFTGNYAQRAVVFQFKDRQDDE